MPENVSVAEASAALGVSPRRVRAMIDDGQLPASRIGRGWAVPRVAVRDALLHRAARGRPWSPVAAWAFLARAAGEPRPAGCSSVDWSRAGQRLRERGVLQELSHLASRALVHRYYAHPSVLRRLQQDPDIVASGISGAGAVGADVIGLDEFEGYIRAPDLAKKVDQYALSDAQGANANVLLRVIDRVDWPIAPVDGVAHPVLVAIDLLEADNERSRRAGVALLEKVLA